MDPLIKKGIPNQSLCQGKCLPDPFNISNDKLWKAFHLPVGVTPDTRCPDGSGIQGIALPTMPRGFVGLLSNQVAVNDLTAEAILQRSKELALQALLVDPVVDKVDAAQDLIEAMISLQPEYLGYLG